jgi:hypothetical protein
MKPGIAHKSRFPFKIKVSPIRWSNAIYATALIAVSKIDIKNIALFAFTKGPDKNAIQSK